MAVSSNDINEAKRRVREMQERAKSYTQAEPAPQEKPVDTPKAENESAPLFGGLDFLSNLMSDDGGSKGLILALILILSKEKADNMLILALLYILL